MLLGRTNNFVTLEKNISPRLNNIFLSPDTLSGRNDVTSDKASFRPDIRQNFSFFEQNPDIKSLYGS